jgi:uncharacterized protein (DUF1697 family)
MHPWLVLFRGINVAGNNIVNIKTLVRVLESLGSERVKTDSQSGNVVLEPTL